MTINPFSLVNKQILVSGASSGIGRAIAVECSKMGATLILTGRNVAELEKTRVSLTGEGHISIPADLNSETDLEFLVSQLPRLDGFVSNAGINRRMLCRYIKKNEMDLIVKTNLTSPILLTKKLLVLKKINFAASVVFISSIAAFHSSIGDSVYSATKGGISSYSKVLALELASSDIRVNTIQPGMIRTSLLENGPLSAEDYARDEKKYPLSRYGSAEEVAYAAVYLLSDATKWVTGTDLVIDGGISLI
jgi:NAD(P)-dependent dehydrogenase (short-subunit alcohol dehydrogenase family)